MILNLTKKNILAENEYHALGFFERARGMIGKKFDGKMDCMVFDSCNSIHMCFMTAALDVIFLDRENRIVKMGTVKPWRVFFGGRNAVKVLELPVGRIRECACSTGDELDLDAETNLEKIRKNINGNRFLFRDPEEEGGGKREKIPI